MEETRQNWGRRASPPAKINVRRKEVIYKTYPYGSVNFRTKKKTGD